MDGKTDWQLDVDPDDQEDYGNDTDQTPDPYGWDDDDSDDD
jgi:hypothetical protein